MTQFEYIQATSGYVHCSCLTCFDIAVGMGEALCSLCEDANCDDYNECQREDMDE
jgi:hypothetical protein